MNTKTWRVFAWWCGLVAAGLCSTALSAQMTEVKEKPPMYSYVANWQIPRAHWGEVEKANAADKAVLEKAMADGTLVGFGNDAFAVHKMDGMTHDNWWSSMSMAGLLKVLEALGASGSSTTSVLESSTKHEDLIMESRYYNWKPGSYKGAYVHVGSYMLKKDAPGDALEMLSKHIVAPLLEKLIADGTLLEYEIDTAAIHSESPGHFWIVYVTANPEGVDKVVASIMETVKQQPLQGVSFGAVTESKEHRDDLLRGDGTFK